MSAVQHILVCAQDAVLAKKVRFLLARDDCDVEILTKLVQLEKRLRDRGGSLLIMSRQLDGEDAIEISKKEKPELILLDIKMKGMDGIAALKHLRGIDRKQKIIMVTALDDQDRIEEASRLGACDYVIKPLMLDYLESTVERNLRTAL